MVLLFLLAACTAAPTEKTYYARWKPDEDKIVSLSDATLYSAAAEIDCSVYDLLGKRAVLLRYDTSGKQKAMEDVNYYKDLYESYLEVNDINIEMTDLNLEYSRSKYRELKQLYGASPTKSQAGGAESSVKAVSMYEKAQEENRKSREINEMPFQATSPWSKIPRSVRNSYRRWTAICCLWLSKK
jgi:L-alanine-DL-glutamate epimerase-like enolase superfamily enzyme